MFLLHKNAPLQKISWNKQAAYDSECRIEILDIYKYGAEYKASKKKHRYKRYHKTAFFQEITDIGKYSHKQYVS